MSSSTCASTWSPAVTPARLLTTDSLLVRGAPLDRAMFCAGDGELPPTELERHADTAVRAFLAAYGRA